MDRRYNGHRTCQINKVIRRLANKLWIKEQANRRRDIYRCPEVKTLDGTKEIPKLPGRRRSKGNHIKFIRETFVNDGYISNLRIDY